MQELDNIGKNEWELIMIRGWMLLLIVASIGVAAEPASRKLVIVAGKPSHPPRMHEFRAGSLLLQECLASVNGLNVEVHANGWVSDDKTLDDADALVIYADGGDGHPAIQQNHLEVIRKLVNRGGGFGCMHYGVQVPVNKGSAEFQRWIGGYYEHEFSVNPIWEPQFSSFPDHPVTRGVKPFSAKDEWYFNMRFAPGFTADKATREGKTTFTPILVAKPSDKVRNGPYVYPAGPYPHIQAEKGRLEAMMWTVERGDGGRGFGFTGGHFHDNWADDQLRKVVLNALVWVAKAEVPANGVQSKVTAEQLNANLDPKGKKK